MSNYLSALALALPENTQSGEIRRRVLEQIAWLPTPTANVSYRAGSSVLIVARQALAEKIEAQLEALDCYLAFIDHRSGAALKSNAWRCSALRISGYLGAFKAHLDERDDEQSGNGNLAKIFNRPGEVFDQVIDCSQPPLIDAAIKPPGYYCPGEDNEAIVRSTETLKEMVGEFEKPRFFNYRADICAHSRSGVQGCRNCLDACPAHAIISVGEKIEVNPHLCQGGGTCASSCPTGAIEYVYPRANEHIDLIRQIARGWRQATDNHAAAILFFDAEQGRQAVEDSIDQLPDSVIPVAVEEIGALGLDILSCALAYGCHALYILKTPQTPTQALDVLHKNLAIIEGVLVAAEAEDRYQLHIVDDLTGMADHDLPFSEAATFGAVGEKRPLIRSAFAFLLRDAAVDGPIPLPEGSPFGTLRINQDACTLCMGCVSQCPGKALQAGGETPALRFIEANCVQCGICTRSCPEQALTLVPQLCLDSDRINRAQPLKEEAPFHCIRCNKPFATQAMISKVTQKLASHWMFQSADKLQRLKMCEDCRVKDLFDKEDYIS